MQLEVQKVVCGQSLLSSSLRVYLNNKNRLQPIIGLSCMTECVKLSGGSEAVYLCDVCVCRLGKADVRSHIMGSLHRYNYIKIHHPDFVSEWKQSTELSKMARPLMEMAQILENREGTGDVQVLKLDAAMFQEITTHSENDVLILLRAIKTEQKQRMTQSQSEKALARSECLPIQSQRTVISPRRLPVQLEKAAVQIDSQRGGFVHRSNPLIGASVKRPASALPWPHDNCLSLIHDDVTDGGQVFPGGSVGEGVGQDGVPAKLIRCEPVFKVSLSLTDGPLLLERNSFSLEPSPASPTHSPVHSTSIGASPQPLPTSLHSVGQPRNRAATRPGNTQTVEYKRTGNARVDPARHNQQLTRGEQRRITDHGLYIRRDQDRADHLFSKNTQLTDAKFGIRVMQDYKLRRTDPSAGDTITDLVSVAQPILLTTGHHSGCVEEESLTNSPPMDKEQEEVKGNVCHSAWGQRLAEDHRTTGCLYSTGERIADSGYSTGSKSIDRMYQTVERSTDSQYFIAEAMTDRGYSTGVALTERGYSTGEGLTERGYSTGEGLTERGYSTGEWLTERGYSTGEGLTERVYSTGEGLTERGYSTGEGLTERGYSTGEGLTERGYSTGEGLTERGYSTGEGLTERGYSTGEGLTERGYSTGEGLTERGYSTRGAGLTDREVLEEEKGCRDEMQKGCGLVVEVMVGNHRRGRKSEKKKRKREKSNFYSKQYFQLQPPKLRQAQGFTGAHNSASGLCMVDTVDLRHGIATYRDQAEPVYHRADMSSHNDVISRPMGDLAAMSQVHLECRRSWLYEGTRLTANTYRTGPCEYETHPNPSPDILHSNPDRFRPEPLQYPHHALAPGTRHHLDSGPFPVKFGGVQIPGYEGFPRALSVTASSPRHHRPCEVEGYGPPPSDPHPHPSHYRYREADRGHGPATSQWAFSAPPRF